eukprot:7034801-Prymnesium_polylepis.1
MLNYKWTINYKRKQTCSVSPRRRRRRWHGRRRRAPPRGATRAICTTQTRRTESSGPISSAPTALRHRSCEATQHCSQSLPRHLERPAAARPANRSTFQ